MMIHADGPSIASRDKKIKNMNEADLISLFDWYDFRDPIGHKLTMCDDFLDLVKAVTGQNLSRGKL
jgi:hypothetical protein